jgi:hypothetical protein
LYSEDSGEQKNPVGLIHGAEVVQKRTKDENETFPEWFSSCLKIGYNPSGWWVFLP